MIEIKENTNNAEEFNYLYDRVQWGAYDIETTKKLLKYTLYSISVYDDNKIIGYGRLIGDEIVFIFIRDVMVVPEYQSKKIGTNIMNKLLEKINEVKQENPYVRVYLGASKGKEDFYRNFGFITRSEAGLGEEIVYCDDIPIWGMNYYGVTFDDSLGEEAMDKALRPALMKVGEEENTIPVRGLSKFENNGYIYTFKTNGMIENFNGIEQIYKDNILIYELHCSGGIIK